MTKQLIYLPVLSGVLFAAITSIPRKAAADSLLPAATYYEIASRQGVGPYNDASQESDQVGTVSVLNLGGPSDLLSASATTAVRLSGADTLNPFVSAYSTYQNTFTSDAQAQITYSFEVLGPAGVQVPLDIALNGSHAFMPLDDGASDNHMANSDIRYALTNESVYDKSCYANTCSFTSSATYLISTNEVLNATLHIDGYGPGPGISQTSLDDTIAIDPANTVPGATLVFSPNLVVPEPDTFWSLLAGFLVCMAWMARLKKSG